MATAAQKAAQKAAAAATKAAEDKAKQTRTRLAINPMSDAPGAIPDAENSTEIADDDIVTALVPKRFKLTLDNHHTIDVHPGTQDMPRAHAEHWFSKNMGVTIYGE